ncbi:diguanylate cyclase [Candidatus Reidiella endopervernicosa]|uniref:Diguanylate cyclase n=1 Tax=Candidatus Reidiella endopervernicosa TaxID=2738883 RepID=A0A6N0HTB9_9GAMM|nr:diguanylate cyclase [Candidatus Reidiella endopervernicosa]
MLTLLVTLAGGFYASLYLNRDRKKLVAENEQDPLTGVHNRRAFEARVKSLERYTLTLINTHYSMVMFDIDHFKRSMTSMAIRRAIRRSVISAIWLRR